MAKYSYDQLVLKDGQLYAKSLKDGAKSNGLKETGRFTSVRTYADDQYNLTPVSQDDVLISSITKRPQRKDSEPYIAKEEVPIWAIKDLSQLSQSGMISVGRGKESSYQIGETGKRSDLSGNPLYRAPSNADEWFKLQDYQTLGGSSRHDRPEIHRWSLRLLVWPRWCA